MKILIHHRTQGTGAEWQHITSVAAGFEGLGHQVFILGPTGLSKLQSAAPAAASKAPPRKTGMLRRALQLVAAKAPHLAFEVLEILYNVVAYIKVNRELNRQSYDLVYERYAFFMLGGAVAANRHRVPFVLEANEVSGIASRVRAQKLESLCRNFEKRLLNRVTSVQVVSSKLKDILVERGFDARRIDVSPNAFDLSKVRSVDSSLTKARSLGLEGKTVVGFAGWFAPWDRLDLTIELFATMSRNRDDLRLLLIGDGENSADLKKLAATLNVSDKVIFTGKVDRSEIYQHLSLIDIALFFHSNDYGSPMTMFEFMALKVPVVVPSLPPFRDAHVPEKTALFFTPLDKADCIRQLERLSADTGLRTLLADNAYQRLANEFTWENNCLRAIASIDRARAG